MYSYYVCYCLLMDWYVMRMAHTFPFCHRTQHIFHWNSIFLHWIHHQVCTNTRRKTILFIFVWISQEPHLILISLHTDTIMDQTLFTPSLPPILAWKFWDCRPVASGYRIHSHSFTFWPTKSKRGLVPGGTFCHLILDWIGFLKVCNIVSF